MLALAAWWPTSAPPTHAQVPETPSFLNSEVRNFDNNGEPLLPTLLLIAATYRIPMGIEQVTSESTTHHAIVRLAHGTVAELLDVCIAQLAGYAWTVRDGAVDIYGQKEWEDPSNLLNFKIPSFVSKDSTLNDANNRLRDVVFAAGARPALGGSSQKPGGMGGDSPGVGALEAKRVNIVAENVSVRSILNRIVVLSPSSGQQVVWVANAPPDQLGKAPSSGLWRLVPVGRPIEPDEKHSKHSP
jgi:hypothetical protein